MLSAIVAGVVGYYAGLYTFLWSQLYSHPKKINNKIEPKDNNLKYKQL